MSDLRELRADLLVEEIRKTRAEAAKAEIELAVAQDVESDRLVKGGKRRILNIRDVIHPDITDKWIDALTHWSLRDPGEPITINISSPGGSVTDGLALFDTIMRLRRQGHHVTTRGMGLVASMAGVILQSGDERIMDERAKLLIHEGSSNFGGKSMTAGEMEDAQFFSKLLREDILNIYASRSNLSKTQIKNRWARKDWILTAEEALKYGFVDKVE